jgi:hypothetical protein
MAVELLLYLEAHLFHHHHLTANIWLRLVRENLIKVKTLDYKLVGRMKNYAYTAQNVTSEYQYITNRWQEGSVEEGHLYRSDLPFSRCQQTVDHRHRMGLRLLPSHRCRSELPRSRRRSLLPLNRWYRSIRSLIQRDQSILPQPSVPHHNHNQGTLTSDRALLL